MKLVPLKAETYNQLGTSSFLQDAFWAQHKAAFGWTPWYFAVELEGQGAQFPLLVLTRKVLGPWSLAYCPHGPSDDLLLALAKVHAWNPGKAMAALGHAIKKTIGTKICLVRFEPLSMVPELDGAGGSDPRRQGLEREDQVGGDPALQRREFLRWRTTCYAPYLVKTPADIQPPDTVILDCSIPLDAILASMRSKTRYNIRLAQKKGVVVTKHGAESLSLWYSLYEETAKRDSISIHSQAYYQRLLEENPNRVFLYLASHEGDVLAGIIVVYQGPRAWYLYGASSNEKRNLMPAYALQWAAIQEAQAAGIKTYDFYGLPPWADEGHPMHGLFQFKTGFGGRIWHFPGSWDLIVRFLPGTIFTLAEGLRLYYYRVIKKK